MAIVLDATPASPTANSFATRAQAITYHEGHLYGDAFIDADADVQDKALITATRLISDALDIAGWQGWPTYASQALPMPRTGLRSRNKAAISSMVIPKELVEATAEYARRLIEAGTMPDYPVDNGAPPGIKSLKAGPVALDFDTTVAQPQGLELPEGVYSKIAWLTESGAQGTTVIPLQRG